MPSDLGKLKKLEENSVEFAEACSQLSPTPLNLAELNELLQRSPALAKAMGKYGSVCYYAADRDGDEPFLRALLKTGQVPLEHINEAIGRASSNGHLSILRLLVEHGGESAILCQNKDLILSNSNANSENGACFRYLK